MSASSGPLLAGGAKLVFPCLDGTVIATDQRSDSYTTGSGRTLVIDGTGSGSSSVNTKVVVSRDIWIKDTGGQEHHIRIQEDIPVRVGQRIAFIQCHGTMQTPGKRDHEAGGLLSVYVVSTDSVHTVLAASSLAKRLANPPATLGQALLIPALWLSSVGLFLSGAFALGLLGFAALSTRAVVLRRNRSARSRAIQGEIQKERQRLIQAIHSGRGDRAAIQTTRTPVVQ